MKTRSKTFILEKEKAWEPAGEGVVRQIMGYDGQIMLVKVKFETGAIGTPHTHYHTQTTYVASGKFERRETNSRNWRRYIYRTGCRTWMHLLGSRNID